jgi:hypothetical protein
MPSIYSTSVTAPAAFAAVSAPDFTVPFEPRSIIVINEDATTANYVEVSFDGVDVHGRLTPGQVSAMKFAQTVKKVWVRRGAGTPVVRIVAEA